MNGETRKTTFRALARTASQRARAHTCAPKRRNTRTLAHTQKAPRTPCQRVRLKCVRWQRRRRRRRHHMVSHSTRRRLSIVAANSSLELCCYIVCTMTTLRQRAHGGGQVNCYAATHKYATAMIESRGAHAQIRRPADTRSSAPQRMCRIDC